MKQFLFTVLCLSALAANAQQYPADSLLKARMSPYLKQILYRQQVKPLAKTTGVKQRVIRETSYSVDTATNAFTAYDSVEMMYNGNLGSYFDYNNIIYYDLSDEYPDVKYSEAIFSEKEFSPSVYPYAIKKRHYNSIGMPDTVSYADYDALTNTPPITRKSIFEYNNDGKLILETVYVDSSGTFVLQQKKKFIYSSNGQLESDSVLNYRLPCSTCFNIYQNASKHVYDAAGNETYQYSFRSVNGGGWDSAGVISSTYYSNNQLQKQITKWWGGGFASSITTDSFGYAGSTLYSFWQQNALDTLTLLGNAQYQYFRVFGANGLPTMVSMPHYNAFTSSVDSFFWHYHQNAYGNPDTIRLTLGINGKTFSIIVFHYETYNDLAVTDTKKQNNILLFPNPANNTITVRRDYAFGAKETAAIWNAAGQKVTEQGLGNSKTSDISINQLTPGIYQIAVQDEKGGVVSRQAFVKK